MANLKLYANGCSFTHGTVPFVEDDHEYYQMYNGYKYTAGYDGTQWPWLLSQKFDFVFISKLILSISNCIRSNFSLCNFKSDSKSKVKSKTPVLDNFGRDLTSLANSGKLDPVIGREKEIERVSQILSRRKKNNPIMNLR